MIDEVIVENLALITRAAFEPARGLTVFTGETGAGKTALLSALKLLIGERADRSLIREGADELRVSGRFYSQQNPHNVLQAQDAPAASATQDAQDVPVVSATQDAQPVHAAQAAQPAQSEEAAQPVQASPDPHAMDSLEDEDDERVVVRRVSADGRSRASINGEMASVSQLSNVIAPLIDLCGQHENQSLMRVGTHMGLLDTWAHEEIAPVVSTYQTAYEEWRRAREAMEEFDRGESERLAQLEEARFALGRIDAVSPNAEEYEELAQSLCLAENAEALATAANAAFEAVAGEGGASDSAQDATFALTGAVQFDESLAEVVSRLRSVTYDLDDIATELRTYRDALDFDANDLQAMQERMAALQGLLRLYGPRIEDVLEKRAAAQHVVDMFENADEAQAKAAARVKAAEKKLAEAGAALHAIRTAKAPEFSACVNKYMAQLEMGSASLQCLVEALPQEKWTSAGPHTVEFLFQPGAEMSPKSLARIASGGEISRVLLAIKAVLGKRDAVETLVFDEIDAGVGGATARALAQVLEQLAETHQVIVVTHLAQIAARASKHYLVEKSSDAVPITTLRELSADERPEEIARMLSGEVTETSLAHARELLA